MKELEKDLGGAYSLLKLIMLLLIFPMVLFYIYEWIFKYNIWQKLFTALWIGVVFYYFDLIPGFHH
jgi:hypothetical protein